MPRGIPKSGRRQFKGRKTVVRESVQMRFEIPDPEKYRISDCGMYIVEKLAIKDEPTVYAVWEYKRVLYGSKSFDEAVAAIKNREADHQEREEEFFRLRAPDAKLVSAHTHHAPVPSTNQTSSGKQQSGV